MSKIQRLDNGQLPAFAWPGGYPLFYLDTENNCLCPDCANINDDFSDELVSCEVNWEDESMLCDHCSNKIESTYGEEKEAT